MIESPLAAAAESGGRRMIAGAVDIDAIGHGLPAVAVGFRGHGLGPHECETRRSLFCAGAEPRVNSDSAVKRRTCHSVLAAPNKTLAKSNKSRTGGEATNKQNRVRSQSNMKTVKRPDETDVAVGRRLKSPRVRCGLSQTQIQKYERGTNRIKVSQLRRATEALGVSS